MRQQGCEIHFGDITHMARRPNAVRRLITCDNGCTSLFTKQTVRLVFEMSPHLDKSLLIDITPQKLQLL